jgi:hypothetical protein
MQTIIGKGEEFGCHYECVGRPLEGRRSLITIGQEIVLL